MPIIAPGPATARPASPFAVLAEVALPPVVVNERNAALHIDFAGLGDAPLARSPISANVVTRATMDALGAVRLADLIQLDASVSDAYNTQGYWDYATVRGFVLDNRANYRRDGMPINAETAIALDNKERVEWLKGTSGMQSGTSAPGGLVNFVVKRPTPNDTRSASLATSGHGGLLASVDLGGRFGSAGEYGYRVNASLEDIASYAHAASGSRRFLSGAMDWRLGRDTLLEAEFETSSRSQPSVPGLSLLGTAVPTMPKPNSSINLNSQPWSQPVVLSGVTASLRLEHAFANEWRLTLQASTQRLKSDDRAAFPFGPNYADGYITYAANGDFDLYDFRSENERRQLEAVQAQLRGKVQAGAASHELQLSLLRSRATDRAHAQAYNYVGTGNFTGNPLALQAFAPDTTVADFAGNRDESSTELALMDAIRWAPQWSSWLGLRHTQLARTSALTNGDVLSRHEQSFTSPWLALGYQINPVLMAYASRGFGVETAAAPNLPMYANAGEVLAALKSGQTEFGIKSGGESLQWSAAWFDVTRPQFADAGSCDGTANSCMRQRDGNAHHQGLELNASWKAAAWRINAGATWLQATREGGLLAPALNGKSPVNVPQVILRAQTVYSVASTPGLEVQANLSHEGIRTALPDESVTLPGWTRADLGTRYTTRVMGVKTSWQLSVDNVFDRVYFKESPLQFGHSYLFTGTPRTFRLAVQTEF